MQIVGAIKDNGKVFDFKTLANSKKYFDNKDIFKFEDKEIFVYIDGKISKLSNKILDLTKSYNSINEKIAFLYSIDFNFEGHICGIIQCFFIQLR